MKNKKKIALLLPLLMPLEQTLAGGFQMHEQNGSVGDVHANYSVNTRDASTNFYNPAGLTEITSPTATNSAVTVANKLTFRGRTYVQSNPAPATPPIADQGKATTDGLHVIPSFHFATPINDRMVFGLSIASPFAAELEWSDKLFTRYNATLNGIKTVNVSPSLGYKINNQLSLGFGPEIQYVDMKINKMVGTTMTQVFQVPTQRDLDSTVTNTLTNTGFGWHGGFLWKPLSGFTLGASYRSKVIHHAEGVSKLKGRLAGLFEDPSPNKVNKSKNLKATIRIPTTMALSAEFSPNHDVSFVATAIRTNWSIVKSFDLENVPTAFVDPVDEVSPMYLKLVKTALDYKDTNTFLTGMHWHYSNSLILKSGFGYDETPTHNHRRDLKTPDGNRFLFGLGANYNYSKNLNLELGWMYVNIPKIKIYNKAVIPPPDIPMTQLNPGETNEIYGKARGYAHVLGLQATFSPQKVMSYFI